MKNIPNIITISRIPLTLLLLFIDVRSVFFFAIFLLCYLTDILDGYIARKKNIESKLGEMLDSIADLFFVFVSLYILLPTIKINKVQLLLIIFVIVIRLSNIIIGYIKHRKIIMLHTKLNKATGGILMLCPILIFVPYLKNIYIFFVLLISFMASINEGYSIIKRSNISSVT